MRRRVQAILPDDIVHIDGHRFDAASGRLWRGTEELALRPKTAAVLTCLTRHHGSMVSRRTLLDEVWPEGFVTDAALTVCINELRAAFGDDRRSPRFIATVPRRGYQLVATAARLGPAAAVAHHDARPFVGRDCELELLERCWQDARDGERQVVFVAAQAGVGKSALVDRFAARVVEEGDALIGRGQCIEQLNGGEPYLPLLDALTGLCRSTPAGEFVDVLESVAPMWVMQLPAVAGSARLERLRATTAGASSERMLRELAVALEVASQQRPLVIVCEDLQSADWSTTELFGYLARRRDPARLLVIGTYRPAELVSRDHPLRHIVAELRAHEQCRLLPLELLSRDAVGSYLAERLAPRRPSASLVDGVYARTEGNALFVTAVVDFLDDHDLLVDVAGEVRCPQPLDQAGLPDTVVQFIDRQLDELAEADRQVLEAASVVGVDFATDAVAAALADPGDPDRPSAAAVEERCSRLAGRTGLLSPSDAAEWPDGTLIAQYRFRHALYRDALYQRMGARLRVVFHRRVGARLAGAWGERSGEIAGELAMHMEQGRELRQAVEFLAVAAERAQRRVAPRATLELADRGLSLLEQLGPTPGRAELELRLRIHQVVAMTALHGLYGDAVESAYQRARTVAADVDDPSLAGPVVYGLWSIAAASSRTADMVAMTDELRRLATRLDDRVLDMRADLMSGLVETVRGRPAAGVTWARRCLEHYDPRADRTQALLYGDDAAVYAHRLTAISSWYVGYPDQARAHAEESCRLAEALGYPHDIFRATTGAMYVDALCRDVRRARERVDTLLRACDRFGMTHTLHQAAVVDAWAHAIGGGSGTATLQPKPADLSLVARNTFLSSLVAETAAAEGDVDRALRIATDALGVARRTGHVQYEAELLRLTGELMLRADPSAEDDAQRVFLEAIAIARRRQARSHELRAVTSLARLWHARGESGRAHRLLAPVYDWFTEGCDTADLTAAAALLGALGALGEPASLG